MKKDIIEYFKDLRGASSEVIATDRHNEILPFAEGLQDSIKLIIKQAKVGGKLLFIGNGASASIASHMAVDFWKNAGIRAFSFNDSALLTCVSNDYGYSYVFEKPIRAFAEEKDVLIAISSSGKSENILQGAAAAKEKGLKIITLSGFQKENPLRKLGCINFYVPSMSYGHVEVVHLGICHSLVDIIIKNKSNLMGKKNKL
jgi:D-sedoheptulose 7-phosphate isomerase